MVAAGTASTARLVTPTCDGQHIGEPFPALYLMGN